jgi:hypothetical protein
MSRKLVHTVGVVALIAGIGRMLRLRAWKRADGPRNKRFHKHWHRTRSDKHPWFAHWEEWAEDEAEKAEPDVETDAAKVVV